jgi:peptidoglycan hydrolase-like protein with peptidoglycan-binding domain
VAHSGDVLSFADDDFAWVEPALETAPTMPVTVRPRRARARRPRRTLKSDLARLTNLLAGQSPRLPLGKTALLAAGLFLAILALVLLVVRPLAGDGSAGPPQRPAAKAKLTEVPAVNAPAKPRTLEPGDRTPAVADLQTALGALGFYSALIDGVYGDSTGAAVLAFQTAHGLSADGVAGPTTMEALAEAVGAGARADATTAQEGLETASAAGRISDAALTRVKGLLDDSVSRLATMPPGRIAAVTPVFHDVAAQGADYNGPRAFALFSMLKANVDFRGEHASSARKDIKDDDGIVYRLFKNHGYQFHPIAAFAHLNTLARHGNRNAVARLAPALAARGVPSGRALVWEYYFPFGGPARWSSGFAQAIAAQALARSAKLLGDDRLLAQAHAAYLGIGRGLYLELGGGLWIREYGFSDMAVLNAHLQSLVSLGEYVRISGDPAATATLGRMNTAARSLLPQFDTGCWSLYSLRGSPASLHYHTYHVDLLHQLAATTGDSFWQETEDRWRGYLSSGGPTAC